MGRCGLLSDLHALVLFMLFYILLCASGLLNYSSLLVFYKAFAGSTRLLCSNFWFRISCLISLFALLL